MSIRKRTSKKVKNGYVYEVYFNYKENGITTRYSKSGFLTKKEAQEHEAIKLAEINETGKLRKDKRITFDQVYQEFLEVGSDQYQENTIYNTKKYYRYCESELGHILITHFDYALLQKFFNKRKNNGLETNYGVKKTIKRVLDYAIKTGYIKNSPISIVTVTGVENHVSREEILAYDDFITLTTALNDIDDFKYKAYSVAIQIGFYTGLRVSEVLALHKEDIMFDDNLINVNKKLIYEGLKKGEFYASNKMKSKKSKALLPMAEPLKEVLEKWFKTNPYNIIVCDIEGLYINPNSMSINIKKIATPMNIRFYFHMLRHTFATTVVTNNVDLKTAQDLMRHSNINTTISTYTHIKDQHKLDVVNNLFKTKSVEKVSKPKSQNKTLN